MLTSLISCVLQRTIETIENNLGALICHSLFDICISVSVINPGQPGFNHIHL